MNKKKTKISKEIKINKKSVRRNYSNQTGITLIALVVTIVVLLILAGVTINAVFSDRGIIKKAQDAQNKANESIQKDMEQINALENWLNENTGESNNDKEVNISTLVGKGAVTKNTKAVDTYGNKITIPKGFKVLEHGTEAGSATYTYSGDTIPAVQDGIVIENGTDGNQFVWVPVGTIKNKSDDSKGATSTITLGRYEFDSNTGALKSNTPAQVASVENYTKAVTISDRYQELSTFRAGNTATDSTAENATARNLAEFISTSLSNGGYYIARFEASGTASKITSKYNQTVLGNITQPNAAKAAREMYGEVKENNELIYASDLVNSYAWDTAIVFIQTYSGKTDYASHNESKTTKAFTATGKNNDKYCNIWDMSGNVNEWTTESSTEFRDSYFYPCVRRGGHYNTGNGGATSSRRGEGTKLSLSDHGFRPLLYVK
jgi:Tfp pilus assembly protein PilE